MIHLPKWTMLWTDSFSHRKVLRMPGVTDGMWLSQRRKMAEIRPPPTIAQTEGQKYAHAMVATRETTAALPSIANSRRTPMWRESVRRLVLLRLLTNVPRARTGRSVFNWGS